ATALLEACSSGSPAANSSAPATTSAAPSVAASSASPAAVSQATTAPAASPVYTPIPTVTAPLKHEGTILANIEDDYSHASGMAAVAQEYMKLYPKVEIKIDPKPIDGYIDWARAQFVGGTKASYLRDCTCPDLVAAGKFVDLTPYLKAVNPYTNKVWQTMFQEGTIIPDSNTGQVVQFNMFRVYVLWFYNRQLWDQVGLKDPPKTWTEFIKVLQTFQDAKILPTPMAGDYDGWARMGISWLDRITADAYMRDSINIIRAQPGDWDYDPKIDATWKYDPKDPYNDAFGKVTRNPVRMIQAFRDGKLSVDNPGYRDWWRHLKQFLKYIQPGFLGVNRDTARQLFLTGKAGIWMDATWFFSQFEHFMGDPANGLKRFDYGTFNLVDIDDSKLVQAPTRTIDNPAGYWVIPKKNQAQNDLEVDFLMFMTEPKMAGLLVNTTLTDPKYDLVGPPTLKDVALPKVWEDRFAVIGGRGQGEGGAPGIHGIDPQSQREWVALAQQYATDKLSEDDFFKKFEASIMQAVPRVAKTQGFDLDHPEKKPNPPK
ncbi:MAG TPA: extracellular solute-binding protein, partial [Chloroflexota bacterium]|nr:extracellular solute-binding protein [Chloroflexota bacterium]